MRILTDSFQLIRRRYLAFYGTNFSAQTRHPLNGLRVDVRVYRIHEVMLVHDNVVQVIPPWDVNDSIVGCPAIGIDVRSQNFCK